MAAVDVVVVAAATRRSVQEKRFGMGSEERAISLHERRTGLACLDNYGSRGRPKSEIIMLPNLTMTE